MMWLYWAIEIQCTWKSQSYAWSCSVDQSLYCSVRKFCSYTHTHKNSIPAGFDHTILVYPSYGTCNQTLPAIPNVLEMSVCKLNLKHIHLSIAVANTLLQAMWYTEIKEL